VAPRHRLKGIPIVVCENEDDYRSFARNSIVEDDIVLEVGCAEGVTTWRIAEKGAFVLGIDKSEKQIDSACKRFVRPNLVFSIGDALDAGSVRKLCAANNIGPGLRELDYVFIDLSGSRPIGTISQVITAFSKVLKPKMFVVKNYHMVALLFNCSIQTPNGSGTQGDHGATGAGGSAGAGGSVGAGGSAGANTSGPSYLYRDSVMLAAAAVVAGLVMSSSRSGNDASTLVIEVPRSSVKVAAAVCCGVGLMRWFTRTLNNGAAA